MKPQVGPGAGRIIRAIVLSLSNDGEDSVMTVGGPCRVVTESVQSTPWASLTFAGERHRLVIRLPGRDVPKAAFAGDDLVVPGVIVAVEHAEWAATPGGAVLTLDLLAIDDNFDFSSIP